MKPDLFLPLLRHVVSLLGGGLTSRGLATDSDVEQIIGAVMVLFSIGWMVVTKLRASKAAGSAAPGVGLKLMALGLLVSGWLVSGCATSRQEITTQETNPTNGIVTVNTTKSSVGTIFQSSQVIEKIRASNGKTQSIGVSGIDQKSDASVFAEAMGGFAVNLANGYATAMTGVKSQEVKTTAPKAGAPVVIPAEWQTNYNGMTQAQKEQFLKLLETCPDGSCLRLPK